MPQLHRPATRGSLPEPAAGRLQRPSWRDARLVSGLVMVLLAMLGGAAALAHFDSTVEMLQATRTLVPGEQLSSGDVKAVKVRMEGRHAGYLKADGLPKGQLVRAVQAGELVPTTAVGDAATLRQKTIALPASTGQSAILLAGSVVDLYVSAKQTSTTGATDFQDPKLLISKVFVARISQAASGLGAGNSDNSIQVQIPESQVPAVLAAINKGAKIDLVPSAGSPVRAGS